MGAGAGRVDGLARLVAEVPATGVRLRPRQRLAGLGVGGALAGGTRPAAWGRTATRRTGVVPAGRRDPGRLLARRRQADRAATGRAGGDRRPERPQL